MTEQLRIIVFIFALASFIVWTKWSFSHKDQSGLYVPIFSWLLHVLVFTIVTMLHLISDSIFINHWSLIVRLHALILIFGYGVITMSIGRKHG